MPNDDLDQASSAFLNLAEALEGMMETLSQHEIRRKPHHKPDQVDGLSRALGGLAQ